MTKVLAMMAFLLGANCFAGQAGPNGIFDGLVICSGGPFGVGKSISFPTSTVSEEKGYDFALSSETYENEGDKVKVIANGDMNTVDNNNWLLTIEYTPKASAMPYANSGKNKVKIAIADEVSCQVDPSSAYATLLKTINK